MQSLTDAMGKTTSYTYDAVTDQLKGVSKLVDGQTVAVGYTYTGDDLSGISHNGFSYSFTKDIFGRATGVKVGSQSLVTYNYDTRGNLTTTEFGNGHKTLVEYDPLDQVKAYKVYNSATGSYETKFRYEYDASGNLGYEYDAAANLSHRYFYDSANRLVKQTASDGSSLTLGFDATGQITQIQESLGAQSYSTAFVYDKDGKLTTLTSAGGSLTHTYDSLGRLVKTTRKSAAILKDTTYTYQAGVNGSTSNLVATVTDPDKTTSYTYDDNGNIKTIQAGSQLITYTYNEISELIREDNEILNKTITYRYDAGGNLLEKKEYAYTTGTLGTPTRTIPYIYADTNWKDKLTSFDGKAITYDAIGNPLSYDGWTYTWEEGRQLKSMTKAGTSLSFKYNSSGLRTEKSVNGVPTKYTYLGGKVAFETTGADTIHYTYDDNGAPFSMTFGGSEYFYLTNVQGDVTGLANAAGATVVSYSYDSWGRLILTDGSMKDTLGVKNPYRYRGYRYDIETRLYVTATRHYDPEIGRFINTDPLVDIALFDEGLGMLAYNLYAYCANNPVNLSDHSGMAVTPANVIGAVIGAVGGAVIGTAIANHFRLTGWNRWACTASTSLLIGVVGYFAGPAIYAAIKPIIINAISAGTLQVNKLAIWVQQTLGIIRPFADKAISKTSQFNVSAKHLLGAGGTYAKFNTANMSTIQSWITTALRNGSNFQVNSSDSYYIIYNMGKVIGTNGEQYIKVVFTITGKIITSYPIK